MDNISSFVTKENKKKATIVLVAIIIVLAMAMYISYTYFLEFDKLTQYVIDLGAFGVVVLFLLNIIQIIIPSVPGQVSGFLLGYFYGPFLGSILSIFGVMLGSFIAFIIARKFGKPFLEKVFKGSSLKKFYSLADYKGSFLFFLIFLLPGFPDDIFCFIIGLTEMKLSRFLIIAFFGRLPTSIVLAMLGNGFAIINFWYVFVVVAFTVGLTILAYLYRKQLHNLLIYIRDRLKR